MRFTSPPRALRLTGRALLLVVIFAAAGLRLAPVAQAALTGTKTCTGFDSTTPVGATVTCTLVVNGSATDIPGAPTSITITAVGSNYTFTGASCIATGGTCTVNSIAGTVINLTCSVSACTTLTVTETLTITAVTPASLSQQVTVLNPLASITVVFVPGTGKTFFVSPGGSDTNDCASAATACLTVNRALQVARDGDTILLAAGTYTIDTTIRVAKLVTIQPVNSSSDKVVLKANPDITIFEVTAQGGPNLHVSISNFTMGGNFKKGSGSPAIRLLNDNYTSITGNIIGAEDLPINNGIVLANSDHASITTNAIQGSTQFVFSPVLIVGKTVTGFGIVTIECFGTSLPGVSDSVTISNNLFTNLWIAGVWLCSDGAGEHEITTNVFRNNWRGIALKDVTDTHVGTNTLIDDRNDGIILYGASLHNRIEGNRIESHVAADAAGIRVGWVADPIMPLDNLLENNQILRVTVGIHVFGARTTVIKGNTIKVSGARTAILLTPSTTLGDPGTQPRDTEITGNTIVFIGSCTPVIGCALRLLGVTVPVLAVDNDWGLRRINDVEAVIWHRFDDEAVGLVTFVPFRNMVVEVSPTAGAGASATPSPGGMPPSGTVSPTPTSSPTTMGGPVTSVSLAAGCTPVSWPGASGVSVADVVMGIMPAAAQQTATVWKKDNGEWRGFGPARDLVSDVFTIRRNDALLVCVGQAATWLIPTVVGGP